MSPDLKLLFGEDSLWSEGLHHRFHRECSGSLGIIIRLGPVSGIAFKRGQPPPGPRLIAQFVDFAIVPGWLKVPTDG